MFHDFEATATVGEDGRIELIVPDAPRGVRVHVAVRELDEAWAARLGAGTLHAPSLPDEAIRREAIYAEPSP